MTNESLAAEIRRKLDEGLPPEDIVQGLVGRGLSAASAQRFVDRAVAESATPTWQPHEPLPSHNPSEQPTSIGDYIRNPDSVETAEAGRDLFRGAAAMTAGIAVSWLSFATPGRARFFYGLVLFGMLWFGRGVWRYASHANPFPWGTVLRHGAVPVATLCAALGYFAVQRERQAQAAAEAELAAADRSRSERNQVRAMGERALADRERAARREDRVARALERLASNHPSTQCDAALQIGRSGFREHAPALVSLLSASTANSVRGCAAAALVDLGDTEPARAVYTEWISGDDRDLRRAGLMGLAEIGPSAAALALPHLTDDLKAADWSERYFAVEALSKLGADAVPLLEVASGDADDRVRSRAGDALRAARQR